MSATRDAMLARIRAATARESKSGSDLYGGLARAYTRTGNLEAAARHALLIERLHEYDAEVTECSPQDLPATIAAQIADSGHRVLVAPSGLPPDWLAPVAEWRIDGGLTHEEIESADGVVTAAFCAVADSGTIVLHHSATEGRRVLTLLPDWHLCVLRASQVVETLPEYFARCATPPSLVTFISGPSATADIEMTRIKGVHGPRFLSVILVRDDGNP
ncbi:MAG TPA: lactate utilization protein C [Terracidiphilus sp.]|jgi:L-lactate dehydrogenase complex protein LldG|nr:lactate utilization protein C [Terracidiphilus sp.]